MPDHELHDFFEDSNQYDSGADCQGDIDSETDEWKNHPSLKTKQSQRVRKHHMVVYPRVTVVQAKTFQASLAHQP